MEISKIRLGSKLYNIKDFDGRTTSAGYFAISMLMPLASESTYSTTSVVSNPEFVSVITDSQDKIICGIRKDGSYVGLDPIEAAQTIVDIIYDIDNP